MDELAAIEASVADLRFGKVLADADPTIPNRCVECGAYRIDGRPPSIHQPGCSSEAEGFEHGLRYIGVVPNPNLT